MSPAAWRSRARGFARALSMPAWEEPDSLFGHDLNHSTIDREGRLHEPAIEPPMAHTVMWGRDPLEKMSAFSLDVPAWEE